MNLFNYKVNLIGLNVLKTDVEQTDLFFYQGHPEFLIPEFSPNLEDIWISFLNYLEKIHGKITDQNGGEIISYEILDKDTGLTQCKYVAYDIQIDDKSDMTDIPVKIEGYVVKDKDRVYFLTTKVYF